MDQVIIIPTLDPSVALVKLVDDLQCLGFKRFIIVDDGSEDRYLHTFRQLEQRSCIVCHHDHNIGKGAAIKTALAKAREAFPDAPAFITVDGDGQHLARDVYRVARESQDFPDALVLGEREFKKGSTPLKSRFGNTFSAAFFRIDTGMTCHDTQTGLRSIPSGMLDRALATEGDRYDYEMNFLTGVAKEHLHIRLVPISTVYEEGNSGSHFRAIHDSYLIYRSFVRFALSSLSCAVVDLGLFTLIAYLMHSNVLLLVAVATVIARLASGVLNFYLNRNWSFSSAGKMPPQLGRYLVLFFSQMAASTLLVSLLAFLPIPLTVVKIIVDSGLFVVSYFVQRNWVFRKKDVAGQGKVRNAPTPRLTHIADAAAADSAAVTGAVVADAAATGATVSGAAVTNAGALRGRRKTIREMSLYDRNI